MNNTYNNQFPLIFPRKMKNKKRKGILENEDINIDK